MILSLPPGTVTLATPTSDVGMHMSLAEFTLVDVEARVTERPDAELRPNEIAANLFALEGRVPRGGFVLNVVRFQSGQVAAVIEDHYWVDGSEHQDGYETSDVVAAVANVEALKACGLLAFARKIAKAQEGILAFGLSVNAVAAMRMRLFKAATANATGAPDDWVADHFVHNLLCDFQNTGVRADKVWRQRALWFKTCAFFGRDIGSWPDSPPRHDDRQQVMGLAHLHGSDPRVDAALDAFTGRGVSGTEGLDA